ncbi:hypothetical protein [Auritidibacter sp. NML100628]|uniref:hypothetical protein n=1 Tax=Auritidibacter sp. NML100628 TaxID=2170742 RepID=UPI0018F1AA67|nr:hypothetical protein [Auritidibacter sp. NML100628]
MAPNLRELVKDVHVVVEVRFAGDSGEVSSILDHTAQARSRRWDVPTGQGCSGTQGSVPRIGQTHAQAGTRLAMPATGLLAPPELGYCVGVTGIIPGTVRSTGVLGLLAGLRRVDTRMG